MSNNNQSETESTEEQSKDDHRLADAEPAEQAEDAGPIEETLLDEVYEKTHIGPVPGTITLHRGDFTVPRCGQLVRDAEGDGGEGVALFVRAKSAAEVHVAVTGETVADHNPDHPEDAPVVGVAFKGQLRDKFEDRWEEWARAEPEYLAFRAGNTGVGVYDFPVTRLEWGADAGLWRCEECETIIEELRLSGDQRADGGPCPECQGPITRLPEAEEVSE